MNRTPHDEWILGQSPQSDRRYLIHTVEPRFIAEIFAADDPEGRLSGLSFELPDERSLGHFVFIDDVPDSETLIALLLQAGNVIAGAHTQHD